MIQFVPKGPNNDGGGKTTQQSSLLKVDPMSKSVITDIYKFTYALFEDSNIKDLIRFLDAFEEVSKNKPLSTVNCKFVFIWMMLTGATLKRWNKAVDNYTQGPENGQVL